MRIDKSKVKIIFEFSPDEYFLCKTDKNIYAFPYSLNARIDRSFKGEDDDITCPKILLTKEEAQTMRENGFTEIL